MANKKITILTRGGLGNIVVTHAKLVEHGRKPYAQYKSAPFVKYVKKGCSKPTRAVFAYDPYLVILAGWQDIASQKYLNCLVLPNFHLVTMAGKLNSKLKTNSATLSQIIAA